MIALEFFKRGSGCTFKFSFFSSLFAEKQLTLTDNCGIIIK